MSTSQEKRLTKAQLAGLRKLVTAQPFKVETVQGQPMIRTGVNTAVLHSLCALGYITVGSIYLRGNVTPDLKILKGAAQRPTRKLVVEQEWSEHGTGDGYWMLLKPGFAIDGVHAIHESSKTAAYKRVRDVRPCACVDCTGKKAAP